MSFGFTFFFAEESVVAAGVASTEEAKRLTGRDEAEETIGVAVAVAVFEVAVTICLLFPPRRFSEGTLERTPEGTAGISKTLRQRGHLKGAWPIQFESEL